jgi:protease-4
MRFLGNVLATIVGLFIFSVIGFFFLLAMAAMIGGGDDTVTVRKKSVVKLDLSKVKHDYAGKMTFTDFDYVDIPHDGVSDVLRAIEFAADDDRIEGIALVNNHTDLGIAQCKAVRDALIKFKESGKFILAYGDMYTQKEYYLASVADKIYLNPVGGMDFKGLSAEVMFYKDLQEKSGIEIDVVRHGKYKSAVEPFLQNYMSDANRLQMTELLQSIWKSIATEIGQSRKMEVATLDHIANGLEARTPELALSSKLIDSLAYEDQFHDDIRGRLGYKKDEKYYTVDILDYAKWVKTSGKGSSASDAIAVIYAQGEILSGEGDVTYIGDGAIRRAIKKAREDKKTKAVVLRVDSPGGSALTSELIWREIELTKKVKPVVVSMGNAAASGGYYIACNANKIFAEPGTITGSIGVFGMLPNASKLADKIGIDTEQVSTHKHAAGFSPFVPLDDTFRGVAQEEVERIYSTFVRRVADGRQMSVAQVDSIGQGRVWSGAQAKELGLVDALGGMDLALAEAAKLAKIEEYRVTNYPEFRKELFDFLPGFGIKAFSADEILKKELGTENYRLLERVRRLKSRQGVQAILPVEIDIR